MIVKTSCYRCGKTIKVKTNNIKESRRVKRKGNRNMICECCEAYLIKGIDKEFKKYEENAIDYLEDLHGFNLKPYQKELLKGFMKGKIYIPVSSRNYRTYPNMIDMLYKFI